jgi:hypothetical protein
MTEWNASRSCASDNPLSLSLYVNRPRQSCDFFFNPFIQSSASTHMCAVQTRKTRRQEASVQRKQEMRVFPCGVNQTIPTTRKTYVYIPAWREILPFPSGTRVWDIYISMYRTIVFQYYTTVGHCQTTGPKQDRLCASVYEKFISTVRGNIIRVPVTVRRVGKN